VGQAEVHDAHAAVVVDHHVVGFEVAMDQAGGVGGRDAAGDVGEHAQSFGPARGTILRPRAEGLAGDELHGDPDLLAVGADVVDGDDVGVRQLGQRLGLAQQAGPVSALTAAGREDQLEGDLAVELGVVGGVDDAHGAGAEAVEEDVAADRRAADELRGGGWKRPSRRGRRADGTRVGRCVGGVQLHPADPTSARAAVEVRGAA
jgi:hypothetical protein